MVVERDALVSSNSQSRPKVFGIGFQKTGTTSLANSLGLLGYRVTGPNGIYDKRIAERAESLVDRMIPRFDAFQDNPWPLFFQHIDRHVPGAKFILTVRDTDAWYDSVLRHFGGTDRPMLRFIYGVGDPRGNRSRFVERYESHNNAVREYFANRSADLLVMDFSAEHDPWSSLCEFLEVPLPGRAFPHSNSGSQRSRFDRSRFRWAQGRLKELLYER
jgi:hypothetical protein